MNINLNCNILINEQGWTNVSTDAYIVQINIDGTRSDVINYNSV